MGLKRKPPTPLLELLEGQPGKDMQGTPQPKAPSPPSQPQIVQTRSSSTKSQPQSPRPKLPASSQPSLPPRPEGTDSKRKRSSKGKETMDGGKSQPSKEKEEAPRIKKLKIGHQSKGKETEVQTSQGKGKGIEAQSLPSAWLPAPMLHGGPLLETALQATYRIEEEVNNKSKVAENERIKRITAAKTLQASEDELAKAKADLTAAIPERDSASAGLASAQKQAEDQTKRLLEAEDQLQIAKDMIEGLSKKLAAVEYDKRVAEYARDEAKRVKREAEFARKEAEVWEEALRRAGVNASSDLWKAENIFYPTAIREATSSSSVAMSDQPEEEVTQSENLQVGGTPGKTLKEGEPQDVIGASQHTDPEAPKEVTKPVVGTQMPNAEEPATLAQPPQAIPLAVAPKSTDTDPVQPSPEGTILQGVEADSTLPSQDVADARPKK
ncbi:uncharacterized protein LOC115961508 [Quercus lobata]|uniref:uncharacterized protein LOC115961508 n=1 Tax=Quercus lobata TaxID=97700 RepID=UPI0012461632|nr:uncharacterized protein LOC115961508 [Quercus lobata]